ncbi:hypothetical protein [Luteimonas lutimaris]|uniref:DUF3757 domain-containing protein n=1 Tax=Luteimonas lutimaris TaxID=698645 RepID=A0ABP7M7A2_9GAMM
MNILLAIGVFAFSLSASAADFCNRQPLDPEVPAGLEGSYEIIGKDPATGKPYAGTLVIGYGNHAYSLTRSTSGINSKGDAWLELCGMDKIQFLVGRYRMKSASVEISCRLGADGDNYYRATCKTRLVGGKWVGLESWFQTP